MTTSISSPCIAQQDLSSIFYDYTELRGYLKMMLERCSGKLLGDSDICTNKPSLFTEISNWRISW
jgi:hypothetical protein